MATNKDNPVSPAHYKTGGIEVVDIWRAKLTKEEFKGACKANILKYVLRADNKGGVEDYKKAQVYLQWLVEAEEGEKKDD